MGRLSVPFGVQGWIKLRTYTESSDGLAQHRSWWLKTGAGWKEYTLEDFAVRPGTTSAKLGGIDGRDAADALKGCEVAVPRASLGMAAKDEIFWVDLIGLAVVNLKGEALGEVTELFEAGGTSVLVLKGERERMIPFVDQYVKSVDREAKRITVDWEAGYDV